MNISPRTYLRVERFHPTHTPASPTSSQDHDKRTTNIKNYIIGGTVQDVIAEKNVILR